MKQARLKPGRAEAEVSRVKDSRLVEKRSQAGKNSSHAVRIYIQRFTGQCGFFNLCEGVSAH